MTAIPTTSWHKILDELRRHDATLIRAWLYDLEGPRLDAGVMIVEARNEAQLRHLERGHRLLALCAQSVLGRLISLDVRLQAGAEELVSDTATDPCNAFHLADLSIDPFVLSPENQLAHAAALQLLSEGGQDYNPLFLHGPEGAGKTHLLHAMCREWNQAGHLPSIYLTGQRFVAQFTEACECSASDRFREPFGRADLLALDNVEFFSGKARSQEELFHVINGLLNAGKRLILAADRPPASMPGIEPRLASRFGAGLVVVMDPPSAEARLRIIQQKNETGAYEFPMQALEQIANRCAPRDLDRVLARLDELAQSSRGQLTMDLVAGVFRKPARDEVFA